MFAADAATFLADYGDPVTWSSSSTMPLPSGLMIFDQADADVGAGEVISREYQVTFETTAWLGLKRGEQLLIGGTGGGATYKLRTDPRQLEDAVFSQAKVTKLA